MTDIEKLLAIEEIRQLRPRYFRVIDAKQFDELEDLFTPDACFDSREAVYDPIKGQYPRVPRFAGVQRPRRSHQRDYRRYARHAAELPYGVTRGRSKSCPIPRPAALSRFPTV